MSSCLALTCRVRSAWIGKLTATYSMAEETQNPSRNVPNAMTTSVIAVSFFCSAFVFLELPRLLMYYGVFRRLTFWAI